MTKLGFTLIEILIVTALYVSLVAVSGFLIVRMFSTLGGMRATQESVVRAVGALELMTRSVREAKDFSVSGSSLTLDTGVVLTFPYGTAVFTDVSTPLTRAVRIEIVSGGRSFFVTVAPRNPLP